MGCSRYKYEAIFAACVHSLFLGLVKPEIRVLHNNNNNNNVNNLKSGCYLFQGKWVIDYSFPLYEPSSCPFIDFQFDCRKNGRPDSEYLKYSWKPDFCNLIRFDGMDLLKRWNGKKIMFVGDSLSVNQMESLSCMIKSSTPKLNTIFSMKTPLSSVTFQDYNVTLYLYRSPYLVNLVREEIGIVLKLDSIRGGKTWKRMDMLIFNSWHWWTHRGKSQPWDYIQDGSTIMKDMDRLTAFYKGLKTWAKWVDNHVDPSKTKLFFQGISPSHYRGKEWNSTTKNCGGEVEPLMGSTYPGGTHPADNVLKQVLNEMKKPIYLLDITTLSQLRKDAHPSVYTGRQPPGMDCSHWCLPGLPDTWNQLLYTALVMLN